MKAEATTVSVNREVRLRAKLRRLWRSDSAKAKRDGYAPQTWAQFLSERKQ